jgi:hypothetical protein
MEDKVLFDAGGQLQIQVNGNLPVLVPFPVCLAIKYENDLVATCADFVLNIEASWVFIRTGDPLPADTTLVMHFYIPPETKLLAEVRGTVVPIADRDMQIADGMLIRFSLFSRWKLRLLERYAKGERHLVDRIA